MQKILVVGGGLAGSCLSFQLSQMGCKVTLVDSGINVSSRVAAGMINPLVFRRMTKSWRVDEFIPYAIDFYQSIERLTDSSFFHPVTIRRFFSSEQERGFWLQRQGTDAYAAYMHEVSDEDETAVPYANQFGSGRVKNSFYLNTNTLLDVLQSFDSFVCRREAFDYNALNAETGLYKDESFDLIVFCEGYQSKNNPWFNYVPIDPTKGETLTIETEGLSQEESFNRKCFTLHIGGGQFRVGATYVWHTDNITITEEGKELLLENLHYLTNEPFKIVNQQAGIRPTTADRRPFMGRHPHHEKLAIFNGLGTKGYLMAPLLAKEMAEYLINNQEINTECRLSRIKK